MIPGRHQPDSKNLKMLVAEQPGLRWSLAGILLALFVGLAFRASFAPEKVTALVQQAAAKIHPDVQVIFENAYLSLSDGLFPELAVVIENVEMESLQPCWKQPLVKIDEIRLPLELTELVRGRVKLATVDVAHVEVLLRAPHAACASNPESPEPVNPESVKPSAPKATTFQTGALSSPIPEEIPDVQATRRNPVENVSIRSLHFQTEGAAWPEVDLRRVRLNSNSDRKELKAEGTIILPLESMAGASPQADFRLFYAPKAEQPSVNFELTGFWREGRFNFHSVTELPSQVTAASLSAQHLPLTEVVGLLRRQSVLERELNGRQAWLSFHASTEKPEKLDDKASLKIDDFKIEGDLGEIEARGFVLTRMNPLEAAPFNLALRGVRLEKLLQFLDVETHSSAIGDLGTFNGALNYRSSKSFELNGEHSGLQFIFSNRGTREMQTLSLISGRALFQNESWQIDLDRIRPLEGLFLGKVRVRADRAWKKVNLNVDMDELTLSPGVQRLMTNGGTMGRWSGEVDVGLVDGRVENLKGQVATSDMIIENLTIERGSLSLNTKADLHHMDIQGKRLHAQSPSPIVDAVKPFLGGSAGPYAAEQFHLFLESKTFDSLRWRLFPIRVNDVVLRSEGSWDPQGDLKGELQQDAGKIQRKWTIKGTRALPQFEEHK